MTRDQNPTSRGRCCRAGADRCRLRQRRSRRRPDRTTAPSSSRPADDGAGVTIVAADIAFDATTFDATVGATVTITFDNRDEGIAHNLHVEGTSAGDAKTEIEERPITQTLDVAFDEAGEFAYFCDVHPQQMRGTVTVSP
ncbi:MAG: cupredoxin domain-containing protein [Acidimicrobiales bacterium]